MSKTYTMRSMRSLEKNNLKQGFIPCDGIGQELFSDHELQLVNYRLVSYMENIPTNDPDYIDYDNEDYYFYLISDHDAYILRSYTDLPIFYCELHDVYFCGQLLGIDFDLQQVACNDAINKYHR